MEIDPRKVAVNLAVKVSFRLGEELWRNGLDLHGEACVDIQALQETIFFHKVKVIVLFLKHGRLQVSLGESVDELHLTEMVGDNAP